jgi:hypothetical protein
MKQGGTAVIELTVLDYHFRCDVRDFFWLELRSNGAIRKSKKVS